MPITPVFEQPPVNPVGPRGIDWTEVIDALTANPGEWARVDGPWVHTKTGTGSSRGKSLAQFAERAGQRVETKLAKKDGEQWLYARLVDEDQTEQPSKPAAVKPAPKPVAAVPDPPAKPPSPNGDFGGDHKCDDCDAKFRTNTRLRQHQANAHKAS